MSPASVPAHPRREDMFERFLHSQVAGSMVLIGFTMSIFIAELAFLDPDRLDEAKMGIFIASLPSGVIGYLLLQKALPKS